MYNEMHNDTDGFLKEEPAPLEFWTLTDFIDLIMPHGSIANAAEA